MTMIDSGWRLATATEDELRRAREDVQFWADHFQQNEPTLSRDEALKAAARLVNDMWTILGPQD